MRENTVSDLVQIVYVSRSTFTTMPAELGIEPSVARILAQSRVNNARRGLVGALYFGDGCFFQCLEGRAADVDRLYAALLRDPRHTDLKLLSRRSIDRTRFSAWTMKYVPLDAEMKALLHDIGQQAFDPYRFDADTVARVLDMLTRGSDIESPAAPPAATPQPVAAASAPATSGRASRWVWAGIGAVAVIVAGVVAMRAFG
ncbi:BLUF domain-containing protein [Lysobacter brunescens]|uniref:BLUF domain-containing protein n=1 Tax=Lysobacter brunescens TaxID=262323 RepID=A0ABW2YCL3_9GAMM